MTVGKKSKSHWLSWKSQLNYDETILLMQVTYRPYKRAFTLRLSSSVYDVHIVTFYAFTNKVLLSVHPKYSCAYIYIDVIAKSFELSSLHEDVKRCLERYYLISG
jgi:hypothetical protein